MHITMHAVYNTSIYVYSSSCISSDNVCLLHALLTELSNPILRGVCTGHYPPHKI